MTQYVATINTPGYLPQDDDPPVFDHPWEAWAYLAGQREREEDQVEDEGTDYSETHGTLAGLGTDAHWHRADPEQDRSWLESHGLAKDGTGTVYGATPGYEGRHDLGVAYSVDVYDGPELDEE